MKALCLTHFLWKIILHDLRDVPTGFAISVCHEKKCHSMGAHLASVHSKAEHNEIQKIIIDASQKLKETWIGGSDAHEVGEWFWSDGSHFDYNDWCPGEPSVQEAQRCLQINYTEEKCWDNIECSTERLSVCVKSRFHTK
ncbi:hypothetical protein NQZ68_018166 [Dissostichus eleginoides]|nr:hypothetical protein NQZ68_018166 [Dissostichus eleginoides]